MYKVYILYNNVAKVNIAINVKLEHQNTNFEVFR